MSNFKFIFEPVKKVKEALEKKTQKEIAILNIEINRNNEEITSIEDEKRKNKLTEMATMTAGDLFSNRSYQKQLDRKIEERLKDIDDLNVKKDKKTDELVIRAKEKKIFTTLEEIHKDNFIKEENKVDIKIVNEIAVQKFARKENEE
jgi:flagellar export protein FliJ